MIKYKIIYKILKNRQILIACLLFFSIFINSCSERKKSTNQGEIEYEIIYLDDENEFPVIGLMPETMTVSYNSDCSKSKMVGFLGFFSTQVISDTKERINYTLIKVQDKKYVYKGNVEDASFIYDSLGEIHIEYVSETKEIAGYTCKKAIATFSNENNPIEIFYTDDINFSDPNRNTPFAEIKGVLLEFQIKLYKINMRFVAKEVRKIAIPKEEFEIPEDYVVVSKEKFEKLINELI